MKPGGQCDEALPGALHGRIDGAGWPLLGGAAGDDEPGEEPGQHVVDVGDFQEARARGRAEFHEVWRLDLVAVIEGAMPVLVKLARAPDRDGQPSKARTKSCARPAV